MGSSDGTSITELLRGFDPEDRSAVEKLTELLYPELRQLARSRMRAERPGHTLQTTALVHEAYLRLIGAELEIESRAHFLALAARLMRRILVDHARGRDRLKRGGGELRVPLSEAENVSDSAAAEILALDAALSELRNKDQRMARLVDLQMFGGLSYPEMAVAVGVSEATVHRDLRMARAWLRRELSSSGSASVEP
jgi:RNA polymerase sigma factor (TIGR02999 family)